MNDATIQEMRRFLKGQYPYESWSRKVDRMSDKQVMAIYFRMIEER